MKKTFLIISIMILAAFVAILIPAAAAFADTGESTPAETWSDAALQWWNQNQGTVASYGAMLISAIMSAIIIRLKSGNSGLSASVNNNSKSTRAAVDEMKSCTDRVEAVGNEIVSLKVDLSAAKAQAEKAAKLTQATVKMLAQVYISSNVPEYVKSLVMETYKAAIDDTDASDKAIADAAAIAEQLSAAKKEYEAKISVETVAVENYR